MAKEAFIDRVFRGYGEQVFGKSRMDLVSSAEVETCRCRAFEALSARTRTYGRQTKGTAAKYFCKYISEILSKKDGSAVIEWWDVEISI